MRREALVLTMMLVFGMSACESDKAVKVADEAETVSDKVEDAPAPAEEVANPEAQEEDVVANEEAKTPAKASSEVVRNDDDTVIDWSTFPLKGEVLQKFAWTDFQGQNAVVMVKELRGKTGGAILVTHARFNADGTWTKVRDLKEVIESCEFDLVLDGFVGEWSVSDVDGDSIGEATFAWNSDCVSDVSPTTFKLFMLEDGQKYALRGDTLAEGQGGKYTMGPEFATAPKSFEAHAKKAWEAALPRIEGLFDELPDE